jgi:hypothetical protein
MDQDEQRSPSVVPSEPLQPVMEVLRGDDPETVCARHRISRAELERRLEDYHKSQRQLALLDALATKPVGRNEPCPCGSGKKYKKCCQPKHEEARRMLPADYLQKAEEQARHREKQEKDVRHGWDLLFAQEYDKAGRLAAKLLDAYPEDDRAHEIMLAKDLATGSYEEAFLRSRRRWQVAQEEQAFQQETGHHKREGHDHKQTVCFYSPSTWLEKFWIAQRARVYQQTFAPDSDAGLKEMVSKLLAANDIKRFPGVQEDGFELRRKALAPVLAQLEAAGPKIIPHLLPLTYNFSWASLFVPDLLFALDTDESIRLLAELSMFCTPYFAPKCLAYLEHLGPRAVPRIARVIEENPAFDELKKGLVMVLGSIHTPESFGLLARLTEHENPHVVNWAAQALGQHQNPEALPYLEKANSRLGEVSEIAGAIRELSGEPG